MEVPGRGFDDGSEKIIACQMERRCAMEQNVWALRSTDQHVRPAAAKKSALAIRSYADVKETGHGRFCALDPLHCETILAESTAQKVTERILADTANQPRLKAPAREREGTVGSNSSYVHFKMLCKAIVAGLWQAFHGAENVHIDVAEDNDRVSKNHWARSLSLANWRNPGDGRFGNQRGGAGSTGEREGSCCFGVHCNRARAATTSK